MTSIPSSPIAALSCLPSVGIAGVASASLLAACAGLPTLTSGDGRLMAGPDAAETRAEPTAKGASSIGQDRRQKPAQRRSGPQLRPPAAGDKQQACVVLLQAASLHAGHYGILSEYGRLALELEQVELAQKLLQEADDPANADWRTISARGTVLVKQGKYREAVALYERVPALAPNQASNLTIWRWL